MPDSMIEFVNRKIRGIDKTFMSPMDDYGCFDMIVHDWMTYAPRWSQFIRNYDVAVQAGGNVGVYPWLLGRKFEMVYTFECDAYNFFCLANNLKQPKFVKFNAAVGDQCKTQKMIPVSPLPRDQLVDDPMLAERVVDGRVMHNTGMSQVGYGPVTIHQMTIDSLNLDKCDLIMLDVETFEWNALVGAKKTIARCKPTIIFESTKNQKEIHELLTKLQYEHIATFAQPDNELWLPKTI